MNRLLLSDIVGAELVGEDGRRTGRVFELTTRRHGDEQPVVRAVLVGRWGLARRLGIARGGGHDEVSIEDVSVEDGDRGDGQTEARLVLRRRE